MTVNCFKDEYIAMSDRKDIRTLDIMDVAQTMGERNIRRLLQWRFGCWRMSSIQGVR